MLFSEAVKLALQSLWANKLRSILTLIGVVMGVASVIMVITLTNTANDYMGTKLSGYGADVFTVSRESSVIFSAEEYFKFQKRKIIRLEDYQAVLTGCNDCKEVGALLSRNTKVVHNGQSSTNTELRGYTATMFSLNNINIALGRALTAADEEHATHTAVVGYDIVDNILGDGDPMGKELRVDGVPYTIVGVGERQGKTFGQSQDNWVAVRLRRISIPTGPTTASPSMAGRMRFQGDGSGRGPDAGHHAIAAPQCSGTDDDFQLETNDTFLDIWKQISQLLPSSF